MDALDRCALGESALQQALHSGLASRWRVGHDHAIAPNGAPHRLILAGLALKPEVDPAHLRDADGAIGDPFGMLEASDLPGRRIDATTTWMLRPPAPVPSLPRLPGLVIRRVVRSADVAEWEHTVFIANGDVSPTLGELHPPATVHAPGIALYLAELNGRAVGTSLRVAGSHSVVISAVAVVPEARGLGIGSALTNWAVAAAPELPATLNASPAGEQLYRGIGFETVGRHTVWSAIDAD